MSAIMSSKKHCDGDYSPGSKTLTLTLFIALWRSASSVVTYESQLSTFSWSSSDKGHEEWTNASARIGDNSRTNGQFLVSRALKKRHKAGRTDRQIWCHWHRGLMWSLKRLTRHHPSEEHLRKKRIVVVSSVADDEELSELLKSYKKNKIRTTKYSFLSFVPKNLFEQLHRFGNIYFIFLAALNFVPMVQAFQPEISVIPITLVLTSTAVKDIWEDYRRFKSDRLINRLPCHIYCRSVKCVFLVNLLSLRSYF